MNKRIQELADQCRSTIGVPGSDSWPETVVFDEQKFAELLVRECIDIVKEDKRISWDDSVNLIDSIKDNFGVE